MGVRATAIATISVALALAAGSPAAESSDGSPVAVAQAIEEKLQTRVGVMVLDTETGRRWGHRANERFPMASTFKAFACAALLAQDAAGNVLLSLMPWRQPWRKHRTRSPETS